MCASVSICHVYISCREIAWRYESRISIFFRLRGRVWRAGPPGPPPFSVFVFSLPPATPDPPGRPLTERSKNLAPATPTALATTSRASRPESPGAASRLLRCRRLQAGGPVPLRALSHPIPELRGRGRTGPSLTQFGDPSRAALRLESLTPGSLLPSLRFGVTLSSLCARYAPFGESPRVLPRSGSSLSQPLRESERLARDGDDDTVHAT